MNHLEDAKHPLAHPRCKAAALFVKRRYGEVNETGRGISPLRHWVDS